MRAGGKKLLLSFFPCGYLNYIKQNFAKLLEKGIFTCNFTQLNICPEPADIIFQFNIVPFILKINFKL